MNRSLALFIASSLLAGCASLPRSYRDTHDVVRLAVSRDRIHDELGEPGTILRLERHPAGCVERWSYAGLRRGDRQEVLFVDFDREGRVCDYAWGETVPSATTEATLRTAELTPG